MDTRKYWLDTMLKIAAPVLENLARDTLKKEMPIEAKKAPQEYEKYVYLEAFGRTVAGLAPWLSCEGLNGEEENLRKKYAVLARECIRVGVNPESDSFLGFNPIPNAQPIVDAAFLAQGLLRAPKELWTPLDNITKKRLAECMKLTRKAKPWENNWLLFSAIIEAFLCFVGEEWNKETIDYAITRHMEWYKGDGHYGDGEYFCADYYNSFVINPMLVDIINTIGERDKKWLALKPEIIKRAVRYATVQERMISPEGSYPAVGRSVCYRFGAFQGLAQMALTERLEKCIAPASVRCALTAVIKRILSFPNTFDSKGWLKIGVCGYQPDLGEHYISTASLYLCTQVFLPLGLSPKSEFWSGEDCDWTQKRLWRGENLPCDHSIK